MYINLSDYDSHNSYLFIYGKNIDHESMNKYNYNAGRNKEIVCYKLDKNLNIIDWGKDEDGDYIYYKTINNYYKINFLDIYYHIRNKELYLINCNENNTEVVNRLFGNYGVSIFKYKNWNNYNNAFIKEINGRLKLFQTNPNGIVIWDLENKEVDAFQDFGNCYTFNILSWKNDYSFALYKDVIIIMKITDDKIEIRDCKNKIAGYSKIRRIIALNILEIIVAIDNHKLKYWTF